MSVCEALTLPGVDAGIWQVRNRFDAAAASIADRHYSRERVGSPQVGGPGYVLVLVTPCERAAWISKRHSPDTKSARVLADGLDAYRCSLFRNEGADLSSDLIVEAVALTERLWGAPPLDGWVTYVDGSAIASVNPGYCFKQAGWWLDREYQHPRLVRLRSNQASSSERDARGTPGASESGKGLAAAAAAEPGREAHRQARSFTGKASRSDSSSAPASFGPEGAGR